MAYFKRTNIFKSFLFSRGSALAIIFVIIFVGYGLASVVGKSMDAAKERKFAEAQAANLKQKHDSLEKKLTLLHTPNGQEAALREQFPVVKPGEHVVVIADATPASVLGSTMQTEEGVSGQKNFWNFFKNLFAKN